MPDKNMPKQTPNQISKAEQQKQQPKQPDIPKNKLDKLFTGVQVVSQLKALGAKMFSKPSIDDTESNKFKEKSETRSAGYDAQIAKRQQIIDTLSVSEQPNVANVIQEQERIKANLQYTKEFHATAGEMILKEKQNEEKQTFEKANPELVEARVNKETKQNLKDLKDQYAKAEDSQQKDQIQAQIDNVNKSHQMQLEKLGGYKQAKQSEKIANEQKAKAEKSEKKSQKDIDKINDKNEQKEAQKRLDDSIRTQFQKTMDHQKEVIARAKNIKGIRNDRIDNENQMQKEYEDEVYSRRDNISNIRKERIAEEKSVEKFQTKLSAREQKAAQKEYDDEVYSRLDNIKSIRKDRIKEEKSAEKLAKKDEKAAQKEYDDEVYSRLDNIKSIRKDRIKEEKSVEKFQSKLESRAKNKETIKRVNSFLGKAAQKAGEKMKKAYHKIKDSMKVDHDKEPLIPAKIKELKAKKQAANLGLENITTKIDSKKTKSSFEKLKDSVKGLTNKKSKSKDIDQSDKMKELNSNLLSKKIDLKEAQKLLKSIEKETNRAGKKDPESDEYAVLDRQLLDIHNLVKEIDLEVKIAEADSFAQESIEKAQQSPEALKSNELAKSKAEAEHDIEKLTIDFIQKSDKLKERMEKNKKNEYKMPDKNIELQLNFLDEEMDKLKEEFGSELARLKSIIKGDK